MSKIITGTLEMEQGGTLRSLDEVCEEIISRFQRGEAGV